MGHEPLVLLPGMNCTAALWEPVVAQLDPPVEVHEVDGRSVDDAVDRLLERLPPRFALAGLSLGGIVAMALHRRAPSRVTRLALLDTNPLAPTDAQRASWQDVVARLDDGLTAGGYQREIMDLLVSGAHRDRLSGIVAAMGDAVGADRLGRQLQMQQTRVDERPGLRSVRVPTLVAYGAEDALCPSERHRDIAGAIGTAARLVEIGEAGHLSPLEQPDRVAAELRAWYDVGR